MKRFLLFIFLIFSTFLLPEIAVACSNTNEKIVGKEISRPIEEQQKSCCNDENKSENHKNGCSNKCEHSCCGCAITSSSTAFNLVSENTLKFTNTLFFVLKEAKFSYISKAISDGFLSIWLIPKIG